MKALIAAVGLLASAPSCPDLYSMAVHGGGVPTATVGAAQAATQGSTTTVTIQVAVTNPNRFPLTMRALEYDLAIDGTPASAGALGRTTVPEQSGLTLALVGSLSWATSAAVLQKLATETNAQYRITGTAHLETPAGLPVDVDFDGSGSFVVPPMPTP
ncbi:MAG TPA: LEA type 2 family protein [Myxococcales bacterium]|jgi:LEA14-like dessication related protein|nr:LEA type 2 family protein [Myxococcales bacterium]